LESHNPQPLVLDTNVALDLLVFCDPVCQPLVDALERGTWRWFATAAMRAEFDDVVRRPAFERWAGRRELFSAQWARWAVMVQPAPRVSPGSTLRCADPDDQMFIDLALEFRPSHLLSRDLQLLCLAGPAAALGVRIGTPAQVGAPMK
jgi:predicted nucleic acid-binding protein